MNLGPALVAFGEVESHLAQLGAGNHVDNLKVLRSFPRFYRFALNRAEFRGLVFLQNSEVHPICPPGEGRTLWSVAQRAVTAGPLRMSANWDLRQLREKFSSVYGSGAVKLPAVAIRDAGITEARHGPWYLQDGAHRARLTRCIYLRRAQPTNRSRRTAPRNSNSNWSANVDDQPTIQTVPDRAPVVPAILRSAGAFWCLYGGYLLVYSWFHPAGNRFVDLGPPMVCVAYGLALYNVHRTAVWAGWTILAVLLGSGFINGLLNWPPFVAFLIAQACLAVFATVVRRRLAKD